MKVRLEFDIDDEVAYKKLIPCVKLYAVIHTSEGVVEIVNDPPGDHVTVEGTNGCLFVKKEGGIRD